MRRRCRCSWRSAAVQSQRWRWRRWVSGREAQPRWGPSGGGVSLYSFWKRHHSQCRLRTLLLRELSATVAVVSGRGRSSLDLLTPVGVQPWMPSHTGPKERHRARHRQPGADPLPATYPESAAGPLFRLGQRSLPRGAERHSREKWRRHWLLTRPLPGARSLQVVVVLDPDDDKNYLVRQPCRPCAVFAQLERPRRQSCQRNRAQRELSLALSSPQDVMQNRSKERRYAFDIAFGKDGTSKDVYKETCAELARRGFDARRLRLPLALLQLSSARCRLPHAATALPTSRRSRA